MPCINYRAFFLGCVLKNKTLNVKHSGFCIHCGANIEPDLGQIKALRSTFAYKLELMHLQKPLLAVAI